MLGFLLFLQVQFAMLVSGSYSLRLPFFLNRRNNSRLVLFLVSESRAEEMKKIIMVNDDLVVRTTVRMI